MSINIENEKDQADALFNVLDSMFSPKSVVDIGCNSGLYLEKFHEAGRDVMGYDYDAAMIAKAKVPATQHDITTPINRKADMAICLEVLEHIPSDKSSAALDTVCSVSDLLIFSAAIPGQGGDGHINCQEKSYWKSEIEKRGLIYCPEETNWILNDLRQRPHIMGWLINNLIVMRRPQASSSGLVNTFKKKMRFHVVSLPHTQTTKEYLPCAYTQKVVNFCRMMKSLGHEVFLYASEDNDAPVDELITCITKDQQRSTLKANDWKKDFFAIDWKYDLPYWKLMNETAITEIKKRIEPTDFICLIGGNCQKPVADAFPNHRSVEFGIGYEGVFSSFRVFESYAWMHNVYGQLGQKDGGYYDTVIPNYFDPADFPFSAEKDDYLLFVGRMIHRKGAQIAADLAKRLGKRLIMAGQGVKSNANGKIVADGFTIEGDHVEHVGTVDVKRRGELMSRAQAVLVPTQYIGPFEGVHVEAMLCGTPVITTDWGVFAETVKDGVTGYRCRTIGEMMWAAENARHLSAHAIREYAVARWSLDSVRYRYQDYFFQLMDLWDKGWYTEHYNPTDKRERGNFQ